MAFRVDVTKWYIFDDDKPVVEVDLAKALQTASDFGCVLLYEQDQQ